MAGFSCRAIYASSDERLAFSKLSFVFVCMCVFQVCRRYVFERQNNVFEFIANPNPRWHLDCADCAHRSYIAVCRFRVRDLNKSRAKTIKPFEKMATNRFSWKKQKWPLQLCEHLSYANNAPSGRDPSDYSRFLRFANLVKWSISRAMTENVIVHRKTLLWMASKILKTITFVARWVDIGVA